MNNQWCSLNEIADFLNSEFSIDRYDHNEQGGIYHPSNRPVMRLGLALEPWPGLPEWIADHQIDTLWIHRPWKLDTIEIPTEIGILSHHLPFDETLTMGYNPLLASLMSKLGQPEPLGYKQATADNGELLPQRPIGMLFDIVGQEFDTLLREVNSLFGGYDRAEAGRCPTGAHTITRIAVVGAMNEGLIREAYEHDADLYLTGQYRKPAQPAVDETGIAVISIGHLRSEEWGLRALADLLHDRWPIVELVMPISGQTVTVMSNNNSA
jgi:putative NIF3 family GTP cyclohydrolase 1 type 2